MLSGCPHQHEFSTLPTESDHTCMILSVCDQDINPLIPLNELGKTFLFVFTSLYYTKSLSFPC